MSNRLTRRTFATSALLVPAALGLSRGGDHAAAWQDASAAGIGDPVEAAVNQSELEVAGNIEQLYQLMHPDSVAEVPLFAVEYWYENSFRPLGPEAIEVSGVEYIEWTWEVNGVTYPDTAEISYTQAYADGSIVEDQLHLVAENESWRWFFGRSREFVDEQIEVASPGVYPGEPGAVPEWAVGALENGLDGFDNLPETYPGEEEATLETDGGPAGDQGRRYVSPDGYPVAVVEVQENSGTGGARTYISQRIDALSRGPGFAVLSWNLSPRTSVPHATVSGFGSDATGNVIYTIVGDDETGRVVTVSSRNQDIIDVLGDLMAQ